MKQQLTNENPEVAAAAQATFAKLDLTQADGAARKAIADLPFDEVVKIVETYHRLCVLWEHAPVTGNATPIEKPVAEVVEAVKHRYNCPRLLRPVELDCESGSMSG